MTTDRKETAFEIAERINRVIDNMARIAQSSELHITPSQARAVYARCVQSNDQKHIGHQHYTINTDKTIDNLRILAPPHLVQLTQRTVKDGMELLYKTDAFPGYSVTPMQIQDLHNPDPNVYRHRIANLLEQNLEISQQKKQHHQRLLERLDRQTAEQANELHRAVMALPLREAIPGNPTPKIIQDIIDILSENDVIVDQRQAIQLHDLANNRPV